MIQVTNLTDTEINKIGLTYANYTYPDNDKGMEEWPYAVAGASGRE